MPVKSGLEFLMSIETSSNEKNPCVCGIPLLEDNGSCSRCGRELSSLRLAQLKQGDSMGLQTPSKCSDCKTMLQVGQKFCSNCGQPAALNAPIFDSSQEIMCNKCEADISHGQKFCGNCGVKIDWLGSTGSEDNAVPRLKVSRNVEIQGTRLNGATLNENSSTRSVWGIVGIVLAVLFIIIYFGGGNSSSNILGSNALSKPAVEYIVPGEAAQTLQQVWGVELNDADGPVSLLEMADQAFSYISGSVGGGVTKSDVEISFQPGNSMHTFFNRLLNSSNAVKAVKERWLALAE